MAEPFLGQIILVPYNFPPNGWAFCNGQLMPISQNTALFSLIGTFYGGNGQTTFALPDLRGRVPISSGQGPGLQNYSVGQIGGEENHTLIPNELAAHTHSVVVTPLGSSDDASQGSPASGFPAVPNVASNGAAVKSYGASGNVNMGGISGTAQPAGGNQPHNNMPPYLSLNYCIALVGIFPSRA